MGSDKVPGLIDGQSWRLDERMDEGQRREFNTGKHGETERNDLLGYADTHGPTAI